MAVAWLRDFRQPSKRLADIVRYNSANPSSKFDGAMLDVEPGSNPDFQGLLDLYKCLQQKAKASGLGLSAAINAFWNAVVTYNQVTKEAYKHIADVNLNSLVVMVHRNIAGTFDSVSRGATILVGLKQTQTNPSEVLEINNYRDSYLNGLLAGRPATNPMTIQARTWWPATGANAKIPMSYSSPSRRFPPRRTPATGRQASPG